MRELNALENICIKREIKAFLLPFALESKFYKIIKKFCKRFSRRLPEIERKRSGNCIEFVYVQFVFYGIVQEIDARNSGAAYTAERGLCVFSDFCLKFGRNVCRELSLCVSHTRA